VGQTVSFTFDALNRQLTEVSPQGTMAYQHDAASRRTRATWPDSFYVTYDNLGLLAHIAGGIGVNSILGFNVSSQLDSTTHDLAVTPLRAGQQQSTDQGAL
jgi:YD repeat-containing protein